MVRYGSLMARHERRARSTSTQRTEVTRLRAPRRHGERRQITVPTSLWEAAGRYAAEHGTTPNDALVRLAAEAAARYERERAIAARAAAARTAILAGIGEIDRAGFLTAQEAAEAAGGLRREG
jgi:hypothetical protein